MYKVSVDAQMLIGAEDTAICLLQLVVSIGEKQCSRKLSHEYSDDV
jgi:hypothetical protein